jgi:PilZ domain
MIQTNKRPKPKHRKERAVRRCPFVAAAEVTDLRSNTRLSARTSEIGMGGCYVDVLNPFPEGVAVQLKIVRDQGSFEAQAKVVYSDPKFGMGLAFTELTPDHRAVLETWLVELVTLLHPTS